MPYSIYMRPVLVSEERIRQVVEELEQRGERVTGVRVRQLLLSRYGARGGVARVYRLLHEAQRAPAGRIAQPPPAHGASDESHGAAIARADLAEKRERVHQERWARETDALKTRLAAAEEAARDVELARQRVAELGRALSSAQLRIAALERALAERVA